jgi:serine phosphatase RsbU (regulator of sigma subunit)
LPPDKLVWFALPNSFIYLKSKDILSGDFYWMEETATHIFIAVADFTGLGVPGALISIIN